MHKIVTPDCIAHNFIAYCKIFHVNLFSRSLGLGVGWGTRNRFLCASGQCDVIINNNTVNVDTQREFFSEKQ